MRRKLQTFIESGKRLFTIAILVSVFNSMNAATFTVTTTADAGAGSLRQAILDANALAGTDNIVFDIATGAQTITLSSAVSITSAMNIDGSTQPGFSGTPLITIAGGTVFQLNNISGATINFLSFASNSSAYGIHCNSVTNSLFTNNIVTGMSNGIRFEGSCPNNTITANDVSGSGTGINFTGSNNAGCRIDNNNISNCTGWGLAYNYGTPASVNSNTFTGCANAWYQNAVSNFTISAPGSGGPNANVYGNHTGRILQVDGSTGVNVSNWDFASLVTSPASSRSPLLFNNTSASIITNNTISGMSNGIRLEGSCVNNTITANDVSGSGTGIYFTGGNNAGCRIDNNNISNCTGWGLSYNYGTPASVNSNTFTGCANGLYLNASNTFTLGSSNIFKNHTGTSIQLDGSSAVNISDLAVNGTGGHAILLNNSSNCVLNGNSTCGRSIGIRIQGSSNGNTISNGNVVSCGIGIQLDATSVNNTTITAVNLFNTTNINNSGANTVITGTTSTNTSPIVSVNSGSICSGSSFTMSPSGAETYSFTGGSAIVTPTINASYTVTGTDANGCVSAEPAISSVTVNPIPFITANSGNVKVCGDVSADFGIVATGNNNTYEWHYDKVGGSDHGVIDGSYTEINFDTDTMTIQQVLTSNYNNYYVYCYVTNEFGCETRSANDTIVANPIPTLTVNSGTICAGQSFTMVPDGDADTYVYSSGNNVVSPTTNATYTVTGTYTLTGCSSTAASSVTVNSLPSLSVVTTNTLLCTGETATLSVSGASTYTWSTTENTADVAVTPSVQTTYTVDGTDGNGCVNTTTIMQDVSLCTGIATLANNNSVISVYPNPNNGLFVIELTSSSKVTVMNALGQEVVKETFEAGKHNLDIQNEANGVYFVKVIENNKQQIIKVIKE